MSFFIFSSRCGSLKGLCIFIFHIILPLFGGLLLYYCYRPQSIIFFEWLQIQPIQSAIAPLSCWQNVLIYNVVDGLWLYALLVALYLIWGEDKSANKWYFWVLGWANGTEFAQYLHWITGTADCLDCLAYFTFFILFFISKQTTS